MQQPPDQPQPPSQPLPPGYQQYPPYQFQPPQGPYAPGPFTQQPPPKKSHKGLWIALAIGLVVVIALCSIVSMAASSASKTVATTSTGAQPTSDTSSSSSSSGNTVVKLGQAIVVDEVSCTATTAQKLQPDDVVTPKHGNEFVVVHVKMVNNGQSDQTYNPYDFHAKSSAGNVTDTETFPPSSYTANSTLDSGTLAPGGKVEGDMIFQIPVGDAKTELTWSPSFFGSSSQYAWVLNVK